MVKKKNGLVLLNIAGIFFDKTTKQLKHSKTKGFINLKSLQKLSSQKLFWDETRLSSLVNKRFGEPTALNRGGRVNGNKT